LIVTLKLYPVYVFKKFFLKYKKKFKKFTKNSKILTAHCPNSVSMLGLLKKGNKSWISKSDNIKRKLKYTLEIINDGKSNVGVNTLIANKIIEEALLKGKIIEFNKNRKLKREVVYSNDTRFDFLCDKNIIEVKNVTLLRNQKIAEFPDAVTERGTKHLKKLIEALKQGYKPFVLFLTQIQGINNFKIAKDIDLNYYKNYLIAKKSGVKFAKKWLQKFQL